MKAAILDFDGVIADTLQLNFEVKKAAFLPYGVELTLKEFIDIWVSPEKGKEGTPYFVKLKNLSIDPFESRAKQRKAFRELYCGKVGLLPGALELIGLLKKKGLPLAIVSSNFKPNIELLLENFNLAKEFCFVLGFDDFERHKPFPDAYLAAVKRLGFQAKDVLVFEDADTGVESAKTAGCSCIAIPNRFTERGDFGKADLVLKSLLEIDEKVLALF